MIEVMRKLIGLGVSQTAIANGIGVSKSAVGAWLRGERVPNDENNRKMKEWLKTFKAQIEEL